MKKYNKAFENSYYLVSPEMQEEQQLSNQIQTTFNSRTQKLIYERMLPNPWKLRLTLCQFSKTVPNIHNTNNQYRNKPFVCTRLRIKLSFQSISEMFLMKDAIKIHVNNCSPYIQTYYEFFYDIKTTPMMYIQAKPYRYTLQEVINIFKFKKWQLPPETVTFVRASLIQIYRYILYLLEKYPGKASQHLRYDLSPKNLAISDDYRLVLINPCISQVNKLQSLVVSHDSINDSLRRQIEKTLKTVHQSIYNPSKKPIQDRGLLQYFSSEQKAQFKITQQMRKMFAWSSVEETIIPEKLFQILKGKVQRMITFQLIIQRQLQSAVIIKYFKDYEGTLIKNLQLGFI